MKIAYFDCFSGISGDMCLGALVDAGVSLKELEKGLRGIPVKGYELSSKKVRRSGLAATKVDVIIKGSSGPQHGNSQARTWNDISKIIRTSRLPEGIRDKGHKIFRSLFEAEAEAHGEALGKIHLHELSSEDCIADIFGTLIGLSLLKIEAVYASPLNLGGGSVRTAHGILPVPAPATAVILKNTPVYSSDVPYELTTPTGAVILKSLSKGFGPMPCFKYEKSGVGAGSRDVKDRPNVLRIFIGEMNGMTPDEAVTVIETNIDDMNPQIYEYVIEELFRMGALDVYLTQIIMKKTRPAVKLSVLCDRDKREDLINTILKETTSIGVRYFETQRVTMDREIREFPSKYGKVRVKTSACGRYM
ncbi:MAG: nickel pincer cofactor biosynthesis protein LarC, partial [Thermodesulfovibrionales bacterium]